MAVVVQKYGGSSVADIPRVKRVAQLATGARRAGDDVVVVVSAMGKTTDGLLKQAHEVSANPDRRELDMLLTVGERISMALLAMAIKDLGYDAISFTGSQSGIITNDTHSDARIMEVRPTRIQDALRAGKIVIVAGYQGVSTRKEVTTLGRGGSDTTAVALAAALNAQRCEIYSDVDGVYTADPRLAQAAIRMDVLSHVEMQEMAEAGAKVLNAQAVEWARRAGIVIHALKTGEPGPGTRVEPAPPRASGGVRAVVQRARVLWLSGEARADELLAFLDGHHAPADLCWLGGGRVTALLPLENLHGLEVFAAQLAEKFGGRLEAHTRFGAVSLVGDGLGASHATLGSALRVLAEAGHPVHHAAHSALRITLVTDADAVPAAVAVLHRAFLETPAAR
ncbi:MAG: aspartate kinase [Deltaproteobacteria bacterium]|nr:aspartate kinase [Deltaproteobacteria bacterium]